VKEEEENEKGKKKQKQKQKQKFKGLGYILCRTWDQQKSIIKGQFSLIEFLSSLLDFHICESLGYEFVLWCMGLGFCFDFSTSCIKIIVDSPPLCPST